ncbi:PspC domain-containing protein [Tannerella sp.]|uniref:PspC domain-containing protein n=1 Tax=Tannerella sp. TaxID=2382127 RepID=UPI003FA207A1
MKKTFTVNLNGIVFHIDEDAYQLLDSYLTNLRIHFSREEGSDEIMSDFEARISELLNERIRLGFSVITIEHVEEVIQRMGKPEELFAGEEKNAGSEFSAATETTAGTAEGKFRKRLMRDPDDKMLGGVASGLAAYFGIDTTLLRLVMILLLIVSMTVPVTIIYIVLWLVLPLARTATDRLVMRGEPVNLENIGRTVTDGFEKASDDMRAYIRTNAPRTQFQKIADFIVSFFAAVFKVGAVLLGILLIPVFIFVLFILLIVVFALIVGGWSAVFSYLPIDSDMYFVSEMPNYMAVWGSISGILLLGIPLMALLYRLFRRSLNLGPMAGAVKWVLLLVWLASLVGVCAIGVWALKEYGGFYFETISQTLPALSSWFGQA